MTTIWTDAQAGRVLLVSGREEELLEGVISVPLARVQKYNADRTECPTGRIIWDAEVPNNGCRKEEHPPALQPRHQDLVRVLVWWSVAMPRIPLLLYKKDVAAAFKWLWVSPRDVRLFGADLGGSPWGVAGSITVLYLVLTFGWRGSPGAWMIYAWVIKTLHQRRSPRLPRWSLPHAFRSFMPWTTLSGSSPTLACVRRTAHELPTLGP